MSIYETTPLEINKRTKNKWNSLNYSCYALLDSENCNMKHKLRGLMDAILNKYKFAYAIIWFFDCGLSKWYYAQAFSKMTLLESKGDVLCYRIESIAEFDQILSYWGEFDVLDIIIFQKSEEHEKFLYDTLLSNYKCYRKKFINRVIESKFILSDSGDGEEVQIVCKMEYSDFVKNTLMDSCNTK